MLFRRYAAVVAVVFTLASLAVSQDAKLSSGEVRVSYEQLRLPGGEDMGFAGLGAYREFKDHFSLGVVSYSAVRGQRGGFITLGATGALHFPVRKPLDLETGMYVGAGGGRGGYALSGGGLLLRAHAGLNLKVPRLGTFGAGVSFIDAPSGGSIRSTQPYISYTLPFRTLTESGWSEPSSLKLSAEEYEALSPRQHELALVRRQMFALGESRTVAGTPQNGFGLFGAEWRTYFDRHWFAKVESEGAMGGNSTGYMQILGGVGFRAPLSRHFAWTTTGSIGAGGGGNVDTAGGLLLDTTSGLQVFVTDHLYVDASATYLRAPTATFQAAGYALKLGFAQNRREVSPQTNYTRVFKANYLRLRMVSQRYLEGSTDWRSHHASEAVDNLGLQLDYFRTPHWYLTGQGIAAYNGNAGAYMTGLVGGGYHHRLWSTMFVEIEGLGGAAGGGGLNMGSGLAFQGNAGLGWQLSDAISIMATGGEIAAANGNFRAHVVGFSVGYHFKSFTQK